VSPDPSLLGNEMILKAKEHLGRQIFSLLSAKRAGDCDRVERKLLDS